MSKFAIIHDSHRGQTETEYTDWEEVGAIIRRCAQSVAPRSENS